MNKPVVIFVTCVNIKEARLIAGALIKSKLAACVNIIDRIESVFWWKGRVDRSKEALLIVKSKNVRLPRIIKLVKSLHSYQVPEIIALPIVSGYKPYLEWINECIS